MTEPEIVPPASVIGTGAPTTNLPTRHMLRKLVLGGLVLMAIILGAVLILHRGSDNLFKSSLSAKVNVYTENEISKMFKGSDKERVVARDYVLANPQAVNPFEYVSLIGALWTQGDKAQAVFWFYIFQSRTRAWSKADSAGDGYNALRASLNSDLGETINGWVGSDISAWHEISSRAISYEKKFPFYKGKPQDIDQKEWELLLQKERENYENDFIENFPSLTPEGIAYVSEMRKQNGLYVGPLDSSGAPLPETWR